MEVEMVIEEASIEDTLTTKADRMSNGHEAKDVGQELGMIDETDSSSLSIQPETPNQEEESTYKPTQQSEDTPTKSKQTPINPIQSRLPIPTSRSNSKPQSTPSPSSISFPSYTLRNNNIKSTPLNLITQPLSFPKSSRSPAPSSRTPITSRTPNLSIRSNTSNLTRSPRSPVPPRTPNLSNKSTTSNLSKTCLTPTKLSSSSSSSSRTTPSNHQLKRPKSIHSMVNETHKLTNGQIPDDLLTPVRSTTSMTNRSTSKATPSKPTQSIREMLAEARKQKSKSPSKDHLSPQWGFQSIGKLIQKAHRTGRLNLGSRMMNVIPMRVYKDLIPPHSIFHPSNLTPPKLELTDKKKEDDEEKEEKDELEEEEERDELEEEPKEDQEEEEEVKWYEKVDLTYLNVALNEISELDYELGGFDCLEHLDVHHNQLCSLPTSFGLLINVVQLNLSSNQFEEFPLPLLSLVNLKELNLSNNLLKKLWEPNWDTLLKKTLSKIGKKSLKSNQMNYNDNEDSTRRISEISLINQDEEFFDFFPSSPSKRKKQNELNQFKKEEKLNQSLIPFPCLEKLFLGSNQFDSNSIFGENGIKLPNSLIELDLSKNPLKKPIDIPKSLTELRKLKLSGCGFNDCVFRFEVDLEYDQLSEIEGREEDQENRNGTEKELLFENLEELDLSNNGIDSLGPLEGFFKQYCYQKRLQYVGLPNGIENVGGGSEEVLKVLVHENFLRNESRRRKAMKSVMVSTPAVPPTTVTTTKTTSTEAKKEFDCIVEAVENLSLDADRSSEPLEPTKRAIPSRRDQIKAMIENRYHSESLTLDLHAQHIQDSDIGEEMNELIEQNLVQTLNLSQNLLNKIPLKWISSLSSDRITSLNLSRNRLSDQDFENVNGSLKNLIELNLSGNYFEMSESLFEWISNNFNSLKKLNLSYNVLKDEQGIQKVWFLEEIDLRGNLMEGLIGLVEIGKRLKELKDEDEEDEDECDELDEFVRDYKWKCIDLRDNHIVKLEPSLGFLSIDDLFVSGNRFRVPLRKVYEGSDGTKNLLKWLKSRYV